MNKYLTFLLVALIFGLPDYGAKYPIIYWIFFCFYANSVIYLSLKSLFIQKIIVAIDIANLIFVSAFLYYLIVYKSHGRLIYPCIFTLFSMIVAVCLALKEDKIEASSEPKRKKPKKKRDEKAKFSKDKSKELLNSKDIKRKDRAKDE